MGAETTISWTNHTFNIAWGCTEVSPACDNCYARIFSNRVGMDLWGKDKTRRLFGEKHWREPLKWNDAAAKARTRKRVFCSSMCDVFENHPLIIGELPKMWELIRKTPWLDWQLLTKRSNRIMHSLPDDWGPNGYPNVWLGVTVESNGYVHRADRLRAVPARVRFISYEPALGALDRLNLSGIHQVIYGAESGPKRRRENLNNARQIQQRCANAGVAFFFKQQSHLHSGFNPYLDGVEYREFPKQEI